MTNLFIDVSGKKFQINFNLLKTIAKKINSDKKYRELAKALVDLGIPSITATLLENDLLQDHYDEIWANGNLETRQKLISADGFIDQLTDAQAQDIINMNDTTILKHVAHWGECLFSPKHKDNEDDEDNNDEQENHLRISPVMANTLMQHILSHPDTRVRVAAAENHCEPDHIVPFKECMELGVVPGFFQIAAMTAEDVTLLANAHSDTLQAIAENIEHISDENVLNDVAEWFVTSSNPAIRLSLAENSHAPKPILERLSADEDGDVAHAALLSKEGGDTWDLEEDEDDEDEWDDEE